MSKLIPEASARLTALRSLLAEEEREVRARTDELLKGKNPKELEAAGVLLRKARISEVRAALFGRIRVTVADDPSRPGHVDRFDVRPGGVVWLMERDDDGRLQQTATGIVARRRRGALEVVFEAADQVSDVDESIDIVAALDEVTLRRMREGLDEAARVEGRTARLVEIVLGAVPPRPTRLSDQVPVSPVLHEDQRLAMLHGVLNEDVALIHGPPGTGKTRVLVEVVLRCVERGERVLALTASNAAVDHLALSLLAAQPSLSLARLGQPARVHPDLEQHTLVALTEAHEHRRMAKALFEQAFQTLRQARRRSSRGRDAWAKEREARAEAGALFADARRLERQAAASVLDGTRVLCGTLTGLRDDLLGDTRFDVLVVDEASQALTPALLLGVLKARRVVLAGDHLQLPPTVISPRAARDGLADTAFATLATRDQAGQHSRMLTVQHRMNELLMTFPSQRFYGERLRAHASVAHHTLADLGLTALGLATQEVGDDGDAPGTLALPGRVLDVIDTAGTGFEEESAPEGSSRTNAGEATIVARLVRDLVAAGLAPAGIGVISPYAAQVALLAQELADLVDGGLEIDSVDGFQGREKEAILITAVRSNSAGEVGFLADQRRLNVAITRAKRKLVIVGDSATLSANEHWRALFDQAIATGSYRSAFELPPS